MPRNGCPGKCPPHYHRDACRFCCTPARGVFFFSSGNFRIFRLKNLSLVYPGRILAMAPTKDTITAKRPMKKIRVSIRGTIRTRAAMP